MSISRPIRRYLESLAVRSTPPPWPWQKARTSPEALEHPLSTLFAFTKGLCKQKAAYHRGYLIIDDVLIQRYSSGHLQHQRFKDLARE